MEKIEIILIVAVIDVGRLRDFTVEELSSFESALTICVNDEYFFATFEPKQQEEIKNALKKVDNELRRRGFEPVNFFKLTQENPARVEYYLKQFSLAELLDMADDLKEYKKSQLVCDFLKLVNKRIYQLAAMA